MKKLVVILPGYYGSKLREAQSGARVWLDSSALTNPAAVARGLRLDAGDPDRVVADGILDHMTIIPHFWNPAVYQGLIGFLASDGRFGEVRSFYYDWRKSLAAAAESLGRQVDGWLYATGAEKVDLVAHSFGGLVARAYLAADGAAEKVDWLVTLGTPHHGMLKTFVALDRGIRMLGLGRAATRDLARRFPSAYELLPSDARMGFFSAPGTGEADVFADWEPGEWGEELLAAAGETLAANLPEELPTKSCLIAGTRLDTPAHCSAASDGELAFDDLPVGDGTVPEPSARGELLTGAEALLRFSVPLSPHMQLFDDTFAQQGILTDLLLERERRPRLFARFAHAPLVVPRSRNRLAAEVVDENGSRIEAATVTFEANGKSVEVPRDTARGDFHLDRVVMPGPGETVGYRVTAEVPGLAPLSPVTGHLVAPY